VRAPRLVSLVLLLQAHGRLTAAELAERLEVSVRTVYRDLEALSGAGIPVWAERGPHGGCQLVDGYRTSLTGLTAREADALFLAGLPGPAADLGLGSVLAAAQLKVLAALPERLRATALLARQRFWLDAPAWFQNPPEHAWLEAVAGAVWEDRRIVVSYRRGDGALVSRALDPFGLVLKGTLWYLVARAEGDTRTYRVSRIEAVEPTGEGFDRDDGFDLAAYWQASTAAFERSLPVLPVTVRISPSGLDLLHLLGESVARSAREAAGDGRGWRVLVLDFERLEYARSSLLRLGAEVEVLGPPELRAALAATARDVSALYGERRAGSRAAPSCQRGQAPGTPRAR
jgi:predicted DNA-binding transcriptional regulator YafY